MSRSARGSSPPPQLTLFGDPPPERPGKRDDGPPSPSEGLPVDPAAADLAARLPATLRFGTSSWSFPGWAGLVYSRPRTPQWLARYGLTEYARHPLFRTVGLDRGYYAPIPEADLASYASQLPAGFDVCTKAPALVTSAIVPESGRTGSPVENPHFLDVDVTRRELLDPFERALPANTGPFIFELPPLPPAFRLDPGRFAEALDQFFAGLPTHHRYGVEIRDRALLTPDYAAVLARHRVAHVCNYWSAMPALRQQAAVVRPDAAPFVMIRLLLKPGTRYDARREAYQPFDKIVDADEGMRGEVVDLLKRAVRATQPAYILVNNKAEGSSPLTIRAIIDRFLRESGEIPCPE